MLTSQDGKHIPNLRISGRVCGQIDNFTARLAAKDLAEAYAWSVLMCLCKHDQLVVTCFFTQVCMCRLVYIKVYVKKACMQVATDALTAMERAMARDKIDTNDRQLACARINSQEGQDYLKAMSCAANFAWVNRSSMTFLVRQAFAKMFRTTPDDLDMHLVYDVSHNIAKV